MDLPADSHVHSEWSWDTGPDAAGTMRRTCERAQRIDLSTLVFTEHFDFETRWRAGHEEFPEAIWGYIDADGYLTPPRLDVDGYFAAVDRCRAEFPDLSILTGVEWGQPHLTEQQARRLVDLDRFDRINGSLHTLADGAARNDRAAGTDEPATTDRAEPFTLFRDRPADEVMEAYFAEIPAMAAHSAPFQVVTHLDYAVRGWPTVTEGPFDPFRFEGNIRSAMRAIADSGRALELNTRRLAWWMPLWWREEGGRAVTFGSDAHRPDALAEGFAEAVGLARHVGFRPGRRPQDFWTVD